jgi:YVTN family beta-propeller protein
VRITPDGTTALVGSLVGADLAVIDLATQTELRRIAGLEFSTILAANFETWAVVFACANPLEIANSTTAIFPDVFNDRVGFVDIATGNVNFVASTDQPRAVAVNAAGTLAVLTHAYGSSNDLDVIDVASQTVIDSIDVGTTMYGHVTLDPAGTKAAVAVQNAVRIVNLGTGVVGPNLNTASVNGLVTTADGQHALCIGYRGSLISWATESLVKNLNNVVSTSVGAVSPADTRAVMFATTFGEDMVVVDTDGGAGFLEEVRPSGPPPEGDKPRTIAVTPDGSLVLTVNQFSKNVSVFDAATMTMLGYVDTGIRPGQVKVTPDGRTAVVTNRDSTFVTVIDLDTLGADQVGISTRGDQLAISPDGIYAYIAVVVSDGVWRVNLDTLSIEGAKLRTGEMGGAGYTGNQFSGMTLSNDGATIVACNTYDDTITIIDAAAWAVVATVAVGDYPTTASFSPDDSQIFVTNRSSETVSVVSNAGGGSAVFGTAVVGAYAFTSVANADGSTLYVMNTSDKTIGVVDTAAFVQTGVIPVEQTPVGIIADTGNDRVLVAIGTASASSNGEMTQFGQLATIETATNTIVETVCADHFLTDLATDAGYTLAAAAGMGGESTVFFDIAECAADITGDGVVNTQDMLAYLNLWTAGDPAADWNNDGVVNTRDFLAFLNDWAAGC